MLISCELKVIFGIGGLVGGYGLDDVVVDSYVNGLFVVSRGDWGELHAVEVDYHGWDLRENLLWERKFELIIIPAKSYKSLIFL